MATYKSFDELVGKKLKYNDIVQFKIKGSKITLDYRVDTCFLANTRGENNDLIFTILSLDKNVVCDRVYGYENNLGGWPETNDSDYKALTRITLVLLGLVEGSPFVDVLMPNNEYVKIESSGIPVYGIFEIGSMLGVLHRDKFCIYNKYFNFSTIKSIYKKWGSYKGKDIAGYAPDFIGNYLYLGCQSISKEEVKEVYNAIIKLETAKKTKK